jgi:hypothetical protein
MARQAIASQQPTTQPPGARGRAIQLDKGSEASWLYKPSVRSLGPPWPSFIMGPFQRGLRQLLHITRSHGTIDCACLPLYKQQQLVSHTAI